MIRAIAIIIVIVFIWLSMTDEKASVPDDNLFPVTLNQIDGSNSVVSPINKQPTEENSYGLTIQDDGDALIDPELSYPEQVSPGGIGQSNFNGTQEVNSTSDPFQTTNAHSPISTGGANLAPDPYNWGTSNGQTNSSSPTLSGGANLAPNLQDWGASMGQTYSDPTDDLMNWGSSMGQDFNDPYSNQQQWRQSMGKNFSQPNNHSSGPCDFPGQC